MTWERLGKALPKDIPDWTRSANPAWVDKTSRRERGIYAPDISFHDGRYYLYYSVAAGNQTSAIGLSTNRTIRPSESAYRWEEHGAVIDSRPGRDDFNAIDPNLLVDSSSEWYLFFGSFFSGIKAIRIDPSTGKRYAGDKSIVAIAARPKSKRGIEGPFVYKHNGAYYLFVSWDACCRGASSDYRVMVGRASNPLGPYVDRQGKRMLDGGGTVILASDTRWRGPGHNGVVSSTKGEFFIYGAWDADNISGGRLLQIRPMRWSADGWPSLGEPLAITLRPRNNGAGAKGSGPH